MKCGEICARSASSSARASRSPCASTSDSSIIAATSAAASPTTRDSSRRTRPGRRRTRPARRRARSWTTSGATIADRSGQPGWSQRSRGSTCTRSSRTSPSERGQRVAGAVVVGARAVERQQPLAVGERDRLAPVSTRRWPAPPAARWPRRSARGAGAAAATWRRAPRPASPSLAGSEHAPRRARPAASRRPATPRAPGPAALPVRRPSLRPGREHTQRGRHRSSRSSRPFVDQIDL